MGIKKLQTHTTRKSGTRWDLTPLMERQQQPSMVCFFMYGKKGRCLLPRGPKVQGLSILLRKLKAKHCRRYLLQLTERNITARHCWDGLALVPATYFHASPLALCSWDWPSASPKLWSIQVSCSPTKIHTELFSSLFQFLLIASLLDGSGTSECDFFCNLLVTRPIIFGHTHIYTQKYALLSSLESLNLLKLLLLTFMMIQE